MTFPMSLSDTRGAAEIRTGVIETWAAGIPAAAGILQAAQSKAGLPGTPRRRRKKIISEDIHLNLRKKSLTLILCMLLCAVILAGCGRSLVITTGFGSGEVFRLGKTRGKVSEIRVYMLDLQKQSENYYGEAIWVSADSEKMQQAVKDQALAQLSRVKALGQIAISRNVMLTKLEEDLAVEAGKNYFAGLSEEEKKYLGLSEKELLNMMREYALAARMWKSLGDSAEDTYEQYYDSTQCDLNTKYWQKISLKRLEGDPSVPGFAECYASAFANVEYEVSDDEEDGSGSGEGAEAPAEAGSENADETGDATGESEKTEQVSGEPADGNPEQDDAALKADDAANEKAEEKAGAAEKAENSGRENAQEQAEKPADEAQEKAGSTESTLEKTAGQTENGTEEKAGGAAEKSAD